MEKNNSSAIKVITIDGPAGSGKSTVAKLVAENLGWIYITTGAIYRTLALLLHESGNEDKQSVHHNLERLISFIKERYRQESKNGRVFLGEREITQEIKSQTVSNLASIFAQDESVREKLLPIQRKVVFETHGAVVDGRDMGTVVFPDAPLKIFLTANSEVRAQRRHQELKELGYKVDYKELLSEIMERDSRDCSRDIAPLRPAANAVVLDSSSLTQEEICEQIIHIATQKKIFMMK